MKTEDAIVILRTAREKHSIGNEKQFKEAIDCLKNVPDEAFRIYRVAFLFKTKPYYKEVIDAALAAGVKGESAGHILDDDFLFEGRTDKASIIKKAFYQAAKTGDDRGDIIEHLTLLDSKPYKKEVLSIMFHAIAKSDRAVDILGLFTDKEAAPYRYLVDPSYKAEIIRMAAYVTANNPKRSSALFKQSIIFHGKPYEQEVLKIAFQTTATHDPDFILKQPNLLKSYGYRQDIINSAFSHSVAQFNSITYEAVMKGDKTLYPHLNNSPLTYDEVEAKLTDLFNKANLYKGQPNPLSKLVVDTHNALNIGYHFNVLHEEPNGVRFKGLNYLTAAQKYDIITLGRSEVYTSTYNALVTSLLEDLRRDKKFLTDVLSPEQLKRAGIFLEAAASYKRLDEVIKVIPEPALKNILNEMVKDVADENTGPSAANTLIASMLALKDHPTIRRELEISVKTHFDKIDDKKSDFPFDKLKFGVVASAYGTFGKDISADQKSFFVGMAHHADYQLPKFQTLPKNQLTDSQGVCNQLMVFADDADSKRSFENFQKTYSNKINWRIDEHEKYICAYSINIAAAPVRIFANKPEHRKDAMPVISHDLAALQHQKSPSFQAFIGRGHSFHADQYIPLITPEMHFVHLGSCGGFQNIGSVLLKSPNAQIISTQETGSMYINDPLLFSINNKIRTEGSVSWPEQQAKLDARHSDKARAYVLPDKNITAMTLVTLLHNLKKASAKDDKVVARNENAALDALGNYIQNRNEFGFFSNGKIDQDELDFIIKSVENTKVGKVTVTQNKQGPDQIRVEYDKVPARTFTVTLDDAVKSRKR